jgi:hypothetical protein
MNTAILEQSGQAQTAYWQMVRAQENELLKKLGKAQSVFITSLDVPLRGIIGGAVKECPPRLAAIGIVEQTHRLATEEEAKQYRATGDENARLLAQAEDDRKQKISLRSSGKDNERDAAIVGAAVKAALQEQAGQQAGGKPPREARV